MKALIIVDIQNDFLPKGALAVPEGDQIIEVVNGLLPHFDLIVATQDWHPPLHGSFASTYPGKQPFETGWLSGLEQVFWPDHCVQGTWGAEMPLSLNTKPVEAIFRKGTDPGIDSYSGFFDNGKRKDTGLAAYLRGRGITHVYTAGLAGDYCVGFTALDALSSGFHTFVIEDATRPISQVGFGKMKSVIRERGGIIVSSPQILPAIQ